MKVFRDRYQFIFSRGGVEGALPLENRPEVRLISTVQCSIMFWSRDLGYRSVSGWAIYRNLITFSPYFLLLPPSTTDLVPVKFNDLIELNNSITATTSIAQWKGSIQLLRHCFPNWIHLGAKHPSGPLKHLYLQALDSRKKAPEIMTESLLTMGEWPKNIFRVLLHSFVCLVGLVFWDKALYFWLALTYGNSRFTP